MSGNPALAKFLFLPHIMPRIMNTGHFPLRAIVPCAIAALLPWTITSCSDCLCSGKGVDTIAKVSLKHHDQPWYRCITVDNKTMYLTGTSVSWTFQHELGYWTAFDIKDKKLRMTAQGKTFTIAPGYVWDGATEGPTTAKLLTPTLFHDAMLHAIMNGAPIGRDQADGAFYQLMKAEKFVMARPYYEAVRNFGDSYIPRQNPPTLIIRSIKK